MSQPAYVCAILVAPSGRLLLQMRPDDAQHAAGRLTCFGGRLEHGEPPEVGLRRELQEELAWTPQVLTWSVSLIVRGELMAWFYEGSLNVPLEALKVEPGFQPVLVERSMLADLPVSDWHRAVLDAWERGEGVVRLSN